jgi:hypothetical protein
MDHVARLQLIGRVTYYIGWLSLLCGGLVHLNVLRTMFAAMQLSQRNLFELGVICFLITIASELRARDVVGREIASTLRKAA